jgi:sugar phosphate isomerase/epimerase
MMLHPDRRARALRGTAFVPPGLSVCQIVAEYFLFEEDIRACLVAGTDGISLWWDKVTAYEVKDARPPLRTHDLPAVSMIGVPPRLLSSEAAAEKATSDLYLAMDHCAELRVPAAGIGIETGFVRSMEDMPTRTETVLQRLAEEARARDVVLAIEPASTMDIDYPNDLQSACRILDRISHPHLKLLFDVQHVRQEPHLHSMIHAAGDDFALVHFSDWNEPTYFPTDRLSPDNDTLRLSDILCRIHATGYTGLYDLQRSSEGALHSDWYGALVQCREFFDSVWKDGV